MKTIHFKSVENLASFVEKINEVSCDVDIYDGHQTFDAKSLFALLCLDLSKDFKVSAVNPSKEEKLAFEKAVEGFIV